MLETYKARIHGDKIEWETDAPDVLRNDQTIEAFVTILPTNAESENLRPFGLGKGDFIVPDDFDAPLPEEVLMAFEK